VIFASGSLPTVSDSLNIIYSSGINKHRFRNEIIARVWVKKEERQKVQLQIEPLSTDELKDRNVSPQRSDESPFPIIQTKVQLPSRAPEILNRNRLVNLIHSHLDRKLIIISAPAGYGKTSLLVDFAIETELAVCWLTLDAYDRDFRLFLEYFIAAIAQRFEKFGHSSRRYIQQINDPSANLYGVSAAIVQDIQDNIPEYFVLILDNFHTVDGQDSITEFLNLLIHYSDENFHLILASRNLVALPDLVLMIARRMAAGLSIDELRFTAREIQNLAQNNYKLELGTGEADHLVQRTAGWITGILLSADPYWKQGISKIPQRNFINQDVYDYLSTQLLDKLPEELRTFLLKTSILDEITPQVCSEVLRIDLPDEQIQKVRERNLFVAEYNLAGNLLRYNDLFREFLRTRFKNLDPEGYRNLSIKVAGYHAGRQEWERAIERFQELGEFSRITAILSYIGREYFDNGRWDSLILWIDSLPNEILDSHPTLLSLRGKIYTERGLHNRALDCFDRAERYILSYPRSSQSELARILVLKASVLRFQDQYMESVSLCQQALVLVDSLTSEDQQTRAMAHKNIGLCWLWLGQSENGREQLQLALRYFARLSSMQDIGMVHHDLGLACELRGDLSGASDQYRTALSYWEQQDNPSPWANELNSLGVVEHLRGNLDLAETSFQNALVKSRQAGDLRIQSFIHASLGDVYRDRNDIQSARRAFQEALEIAHRARAGFIITYALDGLANVARVEGDRIKAEQYLDDACQHASRNGSAFELGMCEISQGILAYELGRLDKAADHFGEAISVAERAGLQQHHSRALLHLSQVEFLAGKFETAWENLRFALAIAESLDYNQYLVFDSSRLLSLLHSARVAGEQIAGLDKLVEKADKIGKVPHLEPVLELPVSQPELTIFSLGNPRVMMDGEEVHWEIAKSRDLFFLILQTPQGLTRDQIGSEFWPDHNPERLEPAFRSTIYRLRRALYRDCIRYMDGMYRFDWTGNYWYDRMEFEGMLKKAESAGSVRETIESLEEALKLYKGDYLQDNFDDWCGLERERLRIEHRSAMEKLARMYVEQKEYPKAKHLYQVLIREDVFNEDVHRELIRCLALSGDRASAIQQYQDLVRVLWDELGLHPDPLTEALYREIID